jgi:hypothetical protein
MVTPRSELITLINRFVSDEERSLRLANEIEGLVLERFREEPWFDDVSLALAQYAPGGGEYLVSDEQLASELMAVMEAIEGHTDDTGRRSAS